MTPLMKFRLVTLPGVSSVILMSSIAGSPLKNATVMVKASARGGAGLRPRRPRNTGITARLCQRKYQQRWPAFFGRLEGFRLISQIEGQGQIERQGDRLDHTDNRGDTAAGPARARLLVDALRHGLEVPGQTDRG